MVNVYELSRYVIKKYTENETDITNLKLQKILYYIQGYFLKFRSRPAFDEDIYRWPYGPVVKEIYFEYNGNGARPICLSQEDMNIVTDLNDVNKADMKIIDYIIFKSYEYKVFDLVEKTHKESPWMYTTNGNIIPKDNISNYFLDSNPLDLKNVN